VNNLTTRQQLAEARIALRLAQDVYDLAKAQAAQRIIDAAGGAKGLGANAEDRDRALTIALAADQECMTAEGTVRTYQAQVDRLQAQLDDEIDLRRTQDRATRADIAAYVRDLVQRPHPHRSASAPRAADAGLANATLQQRVTVLRLFYDYLCEEGWRTDNPVGRGRYTPGTGFGGTRGLLPRYQKLPWIPTDDQWITVLAAAHHALLRNRFMLALAYDAGLRREELCALHTHDIDPAHRLVRIRAETTKGRQERVIPYSEATDHLLVMYLRDRRTLSTAPGPLFLSASRRNIARPVTIWTWSKVVRGLATRSGVLQFTTHTPRHLRLTDLARADWDIHEIARFAGHRSIQTTLLYIHLSGRELADKLARGMAQIHAWRSTLTREVLG
jgi:site-specific recombinase XerD